MQQTISGTNKMPDLVEDKDHLFQKLLMMKITTKKIWKKVLKISSIQRLSSAKSQKQIDQTSAEKK